MKSRLRLLAAIIGLSGLAILPGCSKAPSQKAEAKTPVVPVSKPVQRDVTEFVDFTGRTDAINTVNIVPRVTGYLVKMPFKEGAIVKKDDLLFEIDPRPYAAQLDEAEGQVKLYQAQLKLAQTTQQRDIAISKTPGAVSSQQLDQDQASVEQAEASVKAAQASLEVYRLNLSFCSVTSPIDGMVARYYLTLGNLVNQDQTLLTTVVSLDPIYAYFDLDEPTLVRIRQAIAAGKIDLTKSDALRVYMGVQGETGFPHEGTINFVNNQVNPSTGSIAVRGIFPNPELKQNIRLLAPGMFVRIHLPIGSPAPGVLVVDRAIGSDQGLKFVYVVDQNKVQYRRVTVGALQPDGLRVITEGLKPDEWVAVGAIQQIRPNMTVEAEQMPMPTINQSSGDQPSDSPKPDNKPADGKP